MAVIVKYIVARNGEEKMTFATKKEADAYDKMLDIADNLFDFLETAEAGLTEEQLEVISLLMAERRDEIMPILRGISPKKQAKSAKSSDTAPTPAPAKKSSAKKAPSKKSPASKAAAAAPKKLVKKV